MTDGEGVMAVTRSSHNMASSTGRVATEQKLHLCLNPGIFWGRAVSWTEQELVFMTTLARKRRAQVPDSLDPVMTLVATDRSLTHGVAYGGGGKRRPEALMPRVFSPPTD